MLNLVSYNVLIFLLFLASFVNSAAIPENSKYKIIDGYYGPSALRTKSNLLGGLQMYLTVAEAIDPLRSEEYSSQLVINYGSAEADSTADAHFFLNAQGGLGYFSGDTVELENKIASGDSEGILSLFVNASDPASPVYFDRPSAGKPAKVNFDENDNMIVNGRHCAGFGFHAESQYTEQPADADTCGTRDMTFQNMKNNENKHVRIYNMYWGSAGKKGSETVGSMCPAVNITIPDDYMPFPCPSQPLDEVMRMIGL